MQCEVCGKEAKNAVLVDFEGNRIYACSNCASLGEAVKEKTFKGKKFQKFSPKIQEMSEGLDLVENLGEEVKKSREKKGLTIQELARKVFEKESLLHKIEGNKIVPSDSVVKKLEKELGISLRQRQ